MIPSYISDNAVISLLILISLLGAWTFFLGAGKRFRPHNSDLTSKVALPLLKDESSLASVILKPQEHRRKTGRKLYSDGPKPGKEPAFEGKNSSRELLEMALLMVAVAGDFVVIVLGFVMASQLCQSNLFPAYVENLPMPPISSSYKLILFSSVIVLFGLTGRELYSYRSLLFPSKIWHKAVKAMSLCLFALMGISLVVQTNPAIPWIFFVCAAFAIFLTFHSWRTVLSWVIQLPALSSRLRRRLVVIGGGPQTMRIKKALGGNSDMNFVGWVQAIKPNHIAELEEFRLGSLHELERILQTNRINIAILTESESLQREGVLAVAKACENEHLQFKMVPHFFEILISGLHPEHIGGVQLLGVNCLPLSGYKNRFVKRTIDIVGASVGLALSAPLILIFGALVYWEAPGPILYKQLRAGRNGRMFYIFKIRSMHVNAEALGKPQWAQQNDQRRLRIGTFMRKWNIDEVPQFWNVLIGEMSLVGPRPERPELIARFKSKIPHYQARHIYRPGITGWAQVNGWRGNTDLDERIRHDIWYLENWSVWLDFRIMIHTFFRRENAY